MFNTIHEECCVFGVYSPTVSDVARTTYYGLYALQHRGQESAGIVVNDDRIFSVNKTLGLVSDAFSQEALDTLGQGSIAVGHVRYATTGSDSAENIQPIVVNHNKGKMALSHNGNRTNSFELREMLEEKGGCKASNRKGQGLLHSLFRRQIPRVSVHTFRKIKV